MPKHAPNETLDAPFDKIISECNRTTICAGQPTNFTQANSTFMLASHDLTSGDFAKADGDTSGRKLTIATQPGVTISNTGDPDHVALIDTLSGALLFVTTCSAFETLIAGNFVNFAEWNIELADPT